eukprot:349850-Chlamydomonas_euryale.AAC.13
MCPILHAARFIPRISCCMPRAVCCMPHMPDVRHMSHMLPGVPHLLAVTADIRRADCLWLPGCAARTAGMLWCRAERSYLKEEPQRCTLRGLAVIKGCKSPARRSG